MFAPRVGTGLVISKLPDGRWSAPTAIATAGEHSLSIERYIIYQIVGVVEAVT